MSYFKITGSTDKIKFIELIQADGKLLRTFNKQNASEYSIVDISNGIYYLKITEESNKISFLKLTLIR